MTKRGWLGRTFWMAAFSVLVLILPVATAEAGKLDTKLNAKADGPSEMVDVIFRTFANPNANDHAFVNSHGGTTEAEFTVINGFPGRVPSAALKGLANRASFSGLSFDAPMESFFARNAAGPVVGAPEAYSAYGVSGAGVGVAVVDSGVKLHADLASSKIATYMDYTTNASSTGDAFGHGTHVAGLIAGSGSLVSDFQGIAPGADLHVFRVLDDTGSGTVSNVLRAFDWIEKHATDQNIRVMNFSLGHPVFESYMTDPLCLAIQSLVESGVVVVTSAGNIGRTAEGEPVFGSITSPANSPYAITVGAMNPMGTAGRSDDVMATFSSKGPTAIDFLLKPDVVAPGVFMVSLDSPGSYINSNYGDLEISTREYDKPPGANDYFLLSGTSMASPVVAGIVALMFEQNPSLTPNLVKGILMHTAEDRGYDVMIQGAGYVNAVGALEVASSVTNSPDQFNDTDYWLSTSLSGESTIAGEALYWGGTLYWGNALLWSGNKSSGTIAYNFTDLWSEGLMWGGLEALNTYNFKEKDISSEALFWGGYGSSLFAEAIFWNGLKTTDILYGEGFSWGGGCKGRGCKK